MANAECRMSKASDLRHLPLGICHFRRVFQRPAGVRLSSFEKSCRFIFVRRESMAFGMYFRPTGFTPAVYDNVIKQLEQAGAAVDNVPSHPVPFPTQGCSAARR